NLILTFDGRMKIVDFGIAVTRDRESPDTQVGELKGKPSYMAPEHLRSEPVDRRSDLYSVAVVLHELLTGRKLFNRSSVVQTVLAVEAGRVDPPSKWMRSLPLAVDELVLRGLEKDPARRFSDARAMGVALESLARELGAPSLESFAEDELKSEREKHR